MLHFRFAFLLLILCCCYYHSQSQELFVFSEPASNMPGKSIGVRLNNRITKETVSGKANYQFIPEIMAGVNKRLMLHLETFINNEGNSLKLTGAGAYAKYRVYSQDKVFRHFRMAVFSRASISSSTIKQEEINTFGQNSGYQLGVISTQLLHKTALSGTVYFEHAYNNMNDGALYIPTQRNGINYTLSAGRLLLPKRYTSYKQVNFNFMAEVLGQVLPSGSKYIDIAPSIQLIFNSQTRIDIGYRQELYSRLLPRYAPNGVLLRIEHLFFNVY